VTGSLAYTVLHRLPPFDQRRALGRRRLVDYLAAGIVVRPDPAGVDEWLVATGERVEDRVDGGAVNGGIIGGGHTYHGVR